MRENILRDKAFRFAIRIVRLYQFTKDSKQEFFISKQLLRSGISIGANAREAEQAESPFDFIHKLSISLKEANESDYWIDLLYHTDYLNQKEYESIKKDITELIKILLSSINTCKKNNKVNSRTKQN